MRRYRQGDAVRVTVSAREVEVFASGWPCFGERGPLWFLFSADGQLLDVWGDYRGGEAIMSEEGVAALAEDAARYAGVAK